jgi:alkyl sulfatase BDS1-like metallo-beta-lactamase superfamily hydrolase
MSPLVSALPIPYLHEYYGTVAWSVRAIFDGYLGWFSGMAVNLNPQKSADVDTVAGFRFPDTGEAFTVHVRRGVAEIQPHFPENPDIALTVDSTVWKEVVTGFRNPAIALVKDVDKEGGTLEIVRFLNLFKDD